MVVEEEEEEEEEEREAASILSSRPLREHAKVLPFVAAPSAHSTNDARIN